MALGEIVVTPADASCAFEMARGDIGTVTELLSTRGEGQNCAEMILTVPAAADVAVGVQFGQQGTEYTGSYVGSGSTSTYSRSRVVNG